MAVNGLFPIQKLSHERVVSEFSSVQLVLTKIRPPLFHVVTKICKGLFNAAPSCHCVSFISLKMKK